MRNGHLYFAILYELLRFFPSQYPFLHTILFQLACVCASVSVAFLRFGDVVRV